MVVSFFLISFSLIVFCQSEGNVSEIFKILNKYSCFGIVVGKRNLYVVVPKRIYFIILLVGIDPIVIDWVRQIGEFFNCILRIWAQSQGLALFYASLRELKLRITVYFIFCVWWNGGWLCRDLLNNWYLCRYILFSFLYNRGRLYKVGRVIKFLNYRLWVRKSDNMGVDLDNICVTLFKLKCRRKLR